jgi:hypothetical protein
VRTPKPGTAATTEREFALFLDYYRIRWLYEPVAFPIAWEDRVVEMFTPVFDLPEHDPLRRADDDEAEPDHAEGPQAAAAARLGQHVGGGGFGAGRVGDQLVEAAKKGCW